jgi:uncharacterized protein (TIGR02145 family)
MENIRFFGFWMLLAIGITTVVFNSCGKDEPEEMNPTVDEGVVINGVKWATRNVAAPGTFAAKPEDPGMFYQWNRKKASPVTGDITDWDATVPKGDQWEKANDPSPAGWRVATMEELRTLLDTENVSHEWITENGVNGRKFTDKATGNSIFLPAAGGRVNTDGTFNLTGWVGFYWSNTAGEFGSAYCLYFDSNKTVTWSSYNRAYGFAVRCVAE